jgi:CBS domain containing-hemolysin-like protein
VDVTDSWLLLAFLVCLALSAFFASAEAVVISLSEAGSKLVAQVVYSREH